MHRGEEEGHQAGGHSGHWALLARPSGTPEVPGEAGWHDAHHHSVNRQTLPFTSPRRLQAQHQSLHARYHLAFTSPAYSCHRPQSTEGQPEAGNEPLIRVAVQSWAWASKAAAAVPGAVKDALLRCAGHGLHHSTRAPLRAGSEPRLRAPPDHHTAPPSEGLFQVPFCQVMAGRGAPEVSQASTTDMPSITVLSRGPLVMLGAMPADGDSKVS